MNISIAIDNQLRIIRVEVDKALENSSSNKTVMNARFTIASLLYTLSDMIMARDEGKTEW